MAAPSCLIGASNFFELALVISTILVTTKNAALPTAQNAKKLLKQACDSVELTPVHAFILVTLEIETAQQATVPVL